MADSNELYDTSIQELSDGVISDTDETNGEQESSSQEETDLDAIPASLLSYFETSKSRAAVCEKLILEEVEDFTASHHTEDMMNLPNKLDKDMMKLNGQAICDTDKENNTNLLPAPTETEAHFFHNVSVCPNNKDETGTDEYMDGERHLAFEVRTLESSLNGEESSEYKAEREKRHLEEMKWEEQKKQTEKDFQKELRKIMEAEKLHQKEFELMEKRAHEKLEQEFLLQQELISNLQRRVEEERRMREEEQKRMKDEEDKRKREEKKIKIEAERKRMEDEMRKKEDERKMEELKLKKEKRKNEEEKKRRIEREEKRKREEERNRMDFEKKKLEDEMRMMKEKEERENKEEVERIKKEEEEKGQREEEREVIEEARKEMEKEERNMEEDISLKKEEDRKKEEDNMRIEEEGRVIKESEVRKKQEEMRKKKVEEETDDRRKMVQMEEEDRKKREVEEKEEARENERKMMEEVKEVVRKQEEEKRKMKEELRPIEEDEKRKTKEKKWRRRQKEEMRQKDEEEDRKKKEEHNMRIEEVGRIIKESEVRKKKDEEADDGKKMAQMEEEDRKKREVEEKEDAMEKKEERENRKMEEELIEEDKRRKKEDERKTKEEERMRWQEKDTRRQKEEEEDKISEEMRLKEDKEGYERYDVECRKMGHESKTKDKEKKRKEERKNVEAKKEQNGEEGAEVNQKTEDEMRLKDKEESKKRMVQEKEVRVTRANELQEKTERNSTIGQNENYYIDKAGNSLASLLEDSPTQTSSSPGSLHNESTVCPTSTNAIPHNMTSIDKTVDCKNQAPRPSTVNLSLPVCLPEHTEQKRLSWMKDCIPWSKLSLQNRRKQRGSVRSQRWPRRVPEACSLPPLCPDSLLQSTGWKSLQQVTTVTLEDLPCCSLSTLALCTQLQSLSLRRCGLKSLEGINQLPQLCYIDVQENDISYVDCENMTSLRVLQLGHNNLTSIHGLTGAENLDVLDLSHNSLTRIAGLESVRRLQRLSVDHNQLISTKGLRDVYTLLHLNCSHNHLASVEGLENSALLNTLDLRANSFTEPPSLNNQVLLRELHLDDNSISSLQGLIACWLPLMQHLSVAQNRITQLPSMSDFVSLANLDVRFNCVSELQNVCESLKECQFLQKVHLTGNPVEQESGWRSTLQKSVPGLRGIDDQEIDSFLSPPAVQQVSLASGSFLTFCQDQLQQTHDLQQKHNRELSDASSSLDAVKTSCRYFTEALQLAMDQRFDHEYGDTTVADKHRAAGRTIAEETLDIDSTNVEKHAERPEMESTGKVPPIIPKRGNIRCSSWTFDKKSAAESRHDTFDNVTAGPKTGPTVSKANSGSVHSLATKGRTISANSEMAPVSKHQNLDLQNTAAVVIQQLWRKYRQKCGNISSPSTAEKGGGRGEDGRKPESGPSYINRSVVGQDYAATVIQAFWRGFTLRRRLASALAAVSVGDTREDDTFEEVDLDEFVFDEAALEKHWALPLSEDSPPRRYPVSEQPPSLKPPGAYSESQYILPPPLVWRSKHAWVAGDQVDSAGQRVSPVSSSRSRSPASASVVSGLTKRSEMILEEWGFTQSHTALLMLKRAQKMKSKKQQQKECRNPAVRPDLFRNCSYQLGPVEAWNRQAQHNRNYIKVREAELVLHPAEREQVKQERAQQWLHTQPAHSDRDSESVHFLPEINSDILNGGRVQLVADPGYTQRLHHASGLWANSSLAAQPCEENNYPRRNSLGHARAEIPSPKRVTSAPSKKERISYRDNPVQLSGGWGGGKKRDRVYK
ncbi:leucine-rich repeat and IQ domain-containing protein 1 isoform X1 [Dicentrarchus labrax]|uniref:Leucine-rich repeat and IQ domain-containing protein 1 n=1 Tax=Dicentrarchus labrax TaxID=13489 RepID=A0A8P4K2M3_DICLA|nr:leucine-rich repeat and IQ domain-containing protein 1 isoform X1 [Dicentrarchus labrax]